MALVSSGWTVTVTLTDLGGNKSNMRLSVPAGQLYADVAAAAAAAVTSLGGVTDADITGYTISEKFQDTAVTGAGEVSGQALLVVTTDAAKKAIMRIPAPSAGIFVGASGPSYNTVDVTDGGLLGWLAHFDTGIFEISDGEKFESLDSGKRIHKATREG